MIFRKRSTNIFFWFGLSVGLLASGLAYLYYLRGEHNPVPGLAWMILFPGSLANGDLETGPPAAELFKVGFYSFLNGCIYGLVGLGVLKLKSVLNAMKHE